MLPIAYINVGTKLLFLTSMQELSIYAATISPVLLQVSTPPYRFLSFPYVVR